MAQHNPLEDALGLGVPVDAQGNKTDPLGRGIDDFLRSLLGSIGVPGALPPSGAATIGVNGTPSVPTGIQAAPTPQDLPIPPIPAGTPGPPIPEVTSTELPSAPITGGSGLPVPSPIDSGLDTVGQQVPAPVARTPNVNPIGRAAAASQGSGGSVDNALLEAILSLLSGQSGGSPNVNPIGRAAAATR